MKLFWILMSHPLCQTWNLHNGVGLSSDANFQLWVVSQSASPLIYVDESFLFSGLKWNLAIECVCKHPRGLFIFPILAFAGIMVISANIGFSLCFLLVELSWDGFYYARLKWGMKLWPFLFLSGYFFKYNHAKKWRFYFHSIFSICLIVWSK